MNRREIIRKRWKKLLEVTGTNIFVSGFFSSKFSNLIIRKQPTVIRKDQNANPRSQLIIFSSSFKKSLGGSRWSDMMKCPELFANCTVRQQQNDMHFVEKTSHNIERSPVSIAHPTFRLVNNDYKSYFRFACGSTDTYFI